MVAPYTVEGDSFRAEKPRLWSRGAVTPAARATRCSICTLTASASRWRRSRETQAGKQDKVVFIFNFFDELRRIAPAGQP